MAITRKTGSKSKNVSVNFNSTFSGIKKNLYKEAYNIINEGFEDIVNKTPVDTGYASSNWIVHFGTSKGIRAPEKTGGPYLSKEEVKSRGSFVLSLIKKHGFKDEIRFYNPTPYMGMLEYGHSSQAKFFIRNSVFNMSKKLSEIGK